MNTEEYRRMYDIESTYWWYVGLRKISFDIISRYCRAANKILDAGCGTGILLRELRKNGFVAGADIAKEAVFFCRERGCENVVRSTIMHLPFKDNSFDLITSMDVIYHKAVTDDVAALRELGRALKRGGKLLINVAAYNFMKSQHDCAVHTARRYTKTELVNKLRLAGFKIDKISYWNTVLFPFILLIRCLERHKSTEARSDLKPIRPMLNGALIKLVQFESNLIQLFSLPFGLSLICCATKR